ncbi:hypothetical protein HK101_009352, partial [Irineochytrium annulatum]
LSPTINTAARPPGTFLDLYEPGSPQMMESLRQLQQQQHGTLSASHTRSRSFTDGGGADPREKQRLAWKKYHDEIQRKRNASTPSGNAATSSGPGAPALSITTSSPAVAVSSPLSPPTATLIPPTPTTASLKRNFRMSDEFGMAPRSAMSTMTTTLTLSSSTSLGDGGLTAGIETATTTPGRRSPADLSHLQYLPSPPEASLANLGGAVRVLPTRTGSGGTSLAAGGSAQRDLPLSLMTGGVHQQFPSMSRTPRSGRGLGVGATLAEEDENEILSGGHDAPARNASPAPPPTAARIWARPTITLNKPGTWGWSHDGLHPGVHMTDRSLHRNRWTRQYAIAQGLLELEAERDRNLISSAHGGGVRTPVLDAVIGSDIREAWEREGCAGVGGGSGIEGWYSLGRVLLMDGGKFGARTVDESECHRAVVMRYLVLPHEGEVEECTTVGETSEPPPEMDEKAALIAAAQFDILPLAMPSGAGALKGTDGRGRRRRMKGCPRCGDHVMETARHFLLACAPAKVLWRRLTGVLTRLTGFEVGAVTLEDVLMGFPRLRDVGVVSVCSPGGTGGVYAGGSVSPTTPATAAAAISMRVDDDSQRAILSLHAIALHSLLVARTYPLADNKIAWTLFINRFVARVTQLEDSDDLHAKEETEGWEEKEEEVEEVVALDGEDGECGEAGVSGAVVRKTTRTRRTRRAEGFLVMDSADRLLWKVLRANCRVRGFYMPSTLDPDMEPYDDARSPVSPEPSSAAGRRRFPLRTPTTEHIAPNIHIPPTWPTKPHPPPRLARTLSHLSAALVFLILLVAQLPVATLAHDTSTDIPFPSFTPPAASSTSFLASSTSIPAPPSLVTPSTVPPPATAPSAAPNTVSGSAGPTAGPPATSSSKPPTHLPGGISFPNVKVSVTVNGTTFTDSLIQNGSCVVSVAFQTLVSILILVTLIGHGFGITFQVIPLLRIVAYPNNWMTIIVGVGLFILTSEIFLWVLYLRFTAVAPIKNRRLQLVVKCWMIVESMIAFSLWVSWVVGTYDGAAAANNVRKHAANAYSYFGFLEAATALFLTGFFVLNFYLPRIRSMKNKSVLVYLSTSGLIYLVIETFLQAGFGFFFDVKATSPYSSGLNQAGTALRHSIFIVFIFKIREAGLSSEREREMQRRRVLQPLLGAGGGDSTGSGLASGRDDMAGPDHVMLHPIGKVASSLRQGTNSSGFALLAMSGRGTAKLGNGGRRGSWSSALTDDHDDDSSAAGTRVGAVGSGSQAQPQLPLMNRRVGGGAAGIWEGDPLPRSLGADMAGRTALGMYRPSSFLTDGGVDEGLDPLSVVTGSSEAMAAVLPYAFGSQSEVSGVLLVNSADEAMSSGIGPGSASSLGAGQGQQHVVRLPPTVYNYKPPGPNLPLPTASTSPSSAGSSVRKAGDSKVASSAGSSSRKGPPSVLDYTHRTGLPGGMSGAGIVGSVDAQIGQGGKPLTDDEQDFSYSKTNLW